jgi:hypothetical protein
VGVGGGGLVSHVGYLVLEDFASAEQCAELRRRAERIVNDFDPDSYSVFSTTDQVCQAPPHAHEAFELRVQRVYRNAWDVRPKA